MTDAPANEPRWEDPPAAREGPSLWQRRLAPAVERPGQWLCIEVKSANTASNLRSGGLRLPDGTTPRQWEFAGRSNPTRVYARYLGEAR